MEAVCVFCCKKEYGCRVGTLEGIASGGYCKSATCALLALVRECPNAQREDGACVLSVWRRDYDLIVEGKMLHCLT